jgi:hypothetical protein
VAEKEWLAEYQKGPGATAKKTKAKA